MSRPRSRGPTDLPQKCDIAQCAGNAPRCTEDWSPQHNITGMPVFFQRNETEASLGIVRISDTVRSWVQFFIRHPVLLVNPIPIKVLLISGGSHQSLQYFVMLVFSNEIKLMSRIGIV